MRNEPKNLAREVAATKPVNLLVVAILKGSFVFAADLMRALYRAGLEPQVEFFHLASYYQGTVSSGAVKILRDIESLVRDRDVLLVDDILESGRTLAFAKDLLAARGARRVLAARSWKSQASARFRSMLTSSASSVLTCSSWATAWTSRTLTASCRLSGESLQNRIHREERVRCLTHGFSLSPNWAAQHGELFG